MRASEGQNAYFEVGNAKLTRRVKTLSRSRGLPVSEHRKWNGYGYKTLGYRCDPDVYREATEAIDREEEKAEAKAEALAARVEAERLEADRQRRLALEADLQRRFPLIPPFIRADCLDGRVTAYRPGDPLPTDVYTARQWGQLGCRVRKDATPVGYVLRVEGGVHTALFGPRSVSPTASRKASWEADRLWQVWKKGFDSDAVALAAAVRHANRVVKLAPFTAHKAAFYRVKEDFIRHAAPYLREGRVSRVEERACWGCGGNGGRGRHEEECERCDGTGVYLSRTLYEYLFDLGGEEFCLHSYVRPPEGKLSKQPGADLANYGRRFRASDLARVRLRVPELTRLIEFVVGAADLKPVAFHDVEAVPDEPRLFEQAS